jgi:pantothenate kinase
VRSAMWHHVQTIVARLPRKPGERRLIALAGPPGSGKSTLAEALSAHLSGLDEAVALVPMDGFHLDNRILTARGLLSRKGTPETFDANGFVTLAHRLRAGGEVIVPVFDRTRDIAIAGAAVVPKGAGTVIVEGNYLLFDEDPWRDLAPLWDFSVFLYVPEATLRDRLVQRWRDHGLSPDAALHRAEENDLPNARRILAARLSCNLTL